VTGLQVPLTVRIGGKHITREVAGLSFREEAVGGITDITLRMARPLSKFDPDLAAFSTVTIYDKRSAEAIAQGRLTDTGRSAGSDGQMWDVTAFGPAVSVNDEEFPYILVDTRLDTFVKSNATTRNVQVDIDERDIDGDTPALRIQAPEGQTVVTSGGISGVGLTSAWTGDMISRALRNAGMKLARFRCSWDAGLTDGNYSLRLVTREGGGSGTIADSANANTAGGAMSGQVVTDFPNGDDSASVRVTRATTSIPGAETHWFHFYTLSLRALLLDATGTEITTGYTANTVLAHEVVNDLLGRVLTQFDGANATVDATGSYQINQLAYPDGVTAGKVLEDLMSIESAYRWTTGPDGAFSWELWPTSVRYEATLEDGGSFPASAQELFNKVTVRWRNEAGATKTTTVTATNTLLDNAGITRTKIIDAADEIGSSTAATQLANNFLAEHTYPANAGTLTVNRPIRDLETGRMVLPHEIRAGELIRVRGVEGYPDALNASTNDGQTVFRIWSKSYNSEGDSATLELDTYSRTTANALGLLMTRRTRKR